MRVKIHVCDICGRNIYSLPKIVTHSNYEIHPVKIKMKILGDDNNIFFWNNVELCTDCAKNIYEYCKSVVKNKGVL